MATPTYGLGLYPPAGTAGSLGSLGPRTPEPGSLVPDGVPGPYRVEILDPFEGYGRKAQNTLNELARVGLEVVAVVPAADGSAAFVMKQKAGKKNG